VQPHDGFVSGASSPIRNGRARLLAGGQRPSEVASLWCLAAPAQRKVTEEPPPRPRAGANAGLSADELRALVFANCASDYREISARLSRCSYEVRAHVDAPKSSCPEQFGPFAGPLERKRL
jgi:hypothetical protein